MRITPFSLSVMAVAIAANVQAETEVIEETLVIGTRASLMLSLIHI